MQVLQGMTTNQMIIILPSALIAMYLIITLQKHLASRENKYIGLILPAICFIVSTILAIRPLIVGDTEQSGLLVFCIRMWLTFNISTIIFGFQYIRERRNLKQMAGIMAMQEAMEQENADSEGASQQDAMESAEATADQIPFEQLPIEEQERLATLEYEAKIAKFRR